MNQHVCSPHRGGIRIYKTLCKYGILSRSNQFYLPSSVPHNEPIDDAIDHGAFFVLPTEPSWRAGRLRWRAKILTEFAPHMRIESDGWCVNDLLAEASGKRERERELQEETFGRLTRQWREETAGFSSPARITSNQAYLSIIAFGTTSSPSNFGRTARSWWFLVSGTDSDYGGKSCARFGNGKPTFDEGRLAELGPTI